MFVYRLGICLHYMYPPIGICVPMAPLVFTIHLKEVWPTSQLANTGCFRHTGFDCSLATPLSCPVQ